MNKGFSDVKSQIENSVKDNLDYYKLLGFKIATKTIAGLLKIFIFALLGFLLVFFLAMAGGFALSAYWGNYTYGFLSVAAILCVLLGVVLLLKKRIIDRPILHLFHKILNNKD